MGFFDNIVNSVNKAFGGADAELLQNGILARGHVIGLTPGGTTVQMGNGLVERSCTIQLQVFLDGRPPYEAVAQQRVQEIVIPQLASGAAVVAVRVDPANPANVAVDFSTPPPEVRVAAPSPDDHSSAAWILANGRRAVAVFIASEPIGMSNAAGDPVHALTLTIAEGEGVAQPYQIQVGNAVPAAGLPLAYPGSRLQVRIGDGPNDVVVDWAASGAGGAAPAAPVADAGVAAPPAAPVAPAAPSYLSSPVYQGQPPVVPPAPPPPGVVPPGV